MAPSRARLPTCDVRYSILGADPLSRWRSPILCFLAASIGVVRAAWAERDPAALLADSCSVYPRGFPLSFSGGEA